MVSSVFVGDPSQRRTDFNSSDAMTVVARCSNGLCRSCVTNQLPLSHFLWPLGSLELPTGDAFATSFAFPFASRQAAEIISVKNHINIKTLKIS